MSRSWRTVFSSKFKKVLIRNGWKRGGPSTTAPSDDGWAEIIIYLLTLAMVAYLLIFCWPFVLIALLVAAIAPCFK